MGSIAHPAQERRLGRPRFQMPQRLCRAIPPDEGLPPGTTCVPPQGWRGGRSLTGVEDNPIDAALKHAMEAAEVSTTGGSAEFEHAVEAPPSGTRRKVHLP